MNRPGNARIRQGSVLAKKQKSRASASAQEVSIFRSASEADGIIPRVDYFDVPADEFPVLLSDIFSYAADLQKKVVDDDFFASLLEDMYREAVDIVAEGESSNRALDFWNRLLPDRIEASEVDYIPPSSVQGVNPVTIGVGFNPYGGGEEEGEEERRRKIREFRLQLLRKAIFEGRDIDEFNKFLGYRDSYREVDNINFVSHYEKDGFILFGRGVTNFVDFLHKYSNKLPQKQSLMSLKNKLLCP